jgi:hypothetical protein
MMFRVALFALLSLALNVAAIAHCRVSGPPAQPAELGAHHSASHDHQSDCGKPEKRICDAMVQLTAPDQPPVVPALDKAASIALVVAPAIASIPANAVTRASWHPPNERTSSFKSMHARTGRLLV